jgi:hypothetical protein
MAKMTLDELVAQLKSAFGQGLRAVVLYGSQAGNDSSAKSDVNVLVLVDAIDAGHLQAASAAARAWNDSGNPPPLTLTLDEWHGSADIFPMEYADILERHRVLYGDLRTEIRVDQGHLRLQLEHEAMGTLLQLRRGAMAASSDWKAQLALLEASHSTVMVIFRALLRLRGEIPPLDQVEVAQRVGAITELDAAPFVRVAWHRKGETPIRGLEVAGVLTGYLAGMQRVVRFLDQFAGKGK